MRRVAAGAVLLHRLVTPEERTTPLGMARITGLVDRVLHHEHGPDRSMRVVAVGARHLADRQRVRRNPVDLGALRLVAREARLLLRNAVHDPILRGVDHMAGGAGNVATLGVLRQGSTGTNANSFVGFDLERRATTTLYGQFMLDDIQLSRKTATDRKPASYAFTVGAKGRVSRAAVWTLSQLMGQDEFKALAAKALSVETDDGVRVEWQSA